MNSHLLKGPVKILLFINQIKRQSSDFYNLLGIKGVLLAKLFIFAYVYSYLVYFINYEIVLMWCLWMVLSSIISLVVIQVGLSVHDFNYLFVDSIGSELLTTRYWIQKLDSIHGEQLYEYAIQINWIVEVYFIIRLYEIKKSFYL